MSSLNYRYKGTSIEISLQADHVADDDLESSDLFVRQKRQNLSPNISGSRSRWWSWIFWFVCTTHAIRAWEGIYWITWPFQFQSLRVTVWPHIQHLTLKTFPPGIKRKVNWIQQFLCSIITNKKHSNTTHDDVFHCRTIATLPRWIANCPIKFVLHQRRKLMNIISEIKFMIAVSRWISCLSNC